MARFPLNHETLLEIDITPKAASRTWARVAEGITTAEMSENAQVDQKSYYDDEGNSTSRKIGGQFILTLSGDRAVGDAAQDFIVSSFGKYGDDAETNARVTSSDGSQKTGACTLTGISDGGGDAASLAVFACEIHFNGKPTITPKAVAGALSSVVAAGTVTGTTKFTATAGAGNTLAYKLAAQSAGTVYANQYISNAFAYTSGDNIAASVGQYLQMFEVNTYGRVVLFSEALLDSGDFPA